jgi:hypothetical protein
MQKWREAPLKKAFATCRMLALLLTDVRHWAHTLGGFRVGRVKVVCQSALVGSFCVRGLNFYRRVGKIFLYVTHTQVGRKMASLFAAKNFNSLIKSCKCA